MMELVDEIDALDKRMYHLKSEIDCKSTMEMYLSVSFIYKVSPPLQSKGLN